MSRAARRSRGGQRAGLEAQRGVSLVEAIVAMAVMAFGMMAIVGLQSTLRLNSDVAKQRSEAVRIAEDAIESWRAYSVIAPAAGLAAYDDIALGALAEIAVPGTNTTFAVEAHGNPRAGVEVDPCRSVLGRPCRPGAERDPEQHRRSQRSGTVRCLVSAPRQWHRRSAVGSGPIVPQAAIALAGDNTKSAYRPPGAHEDTVWVFDTLTGVITSVCTFPGEDISLLVPADNCFEQPSWLISGFVRFSFGPNPSATTRPTSRSTCACSPLPSVTRSPTATVSSRRCRTRS